ncbi:hypothetical protein A3K73_05485 [Candidatus Pacearchaeota archaeon RBG_13_36_9]|nr:MAG: hypothetical protein A3K73_05485 [Candidatus Pacearchaeota archaeon RBG_13_36_9]
MLIFLICMIQLASAAHFIVGRVGDSWYGESANGKEVVLWNPSNGIDDNLTDTIGPTGNSGADNIYMIDCEMLSTPCIVGSEIRVGVVDYSAYDVNLSVTGAGYDVAPNMSLNSKPNVTSISVDDAITGPSNEIDLIAASKRNVICEIVVEEYDKDALQNAAAEFYHSSSYIGDSDDNNSNYRNASCFKDESYGTEYETKFLCGFDVLYYANPGTWACFFEVEDNLSVSGNGSDSTSVNTLLSVGVQDIIAYEISDADEISGEVEVNITNYGNIMVNLSVRGYGESLEDGLAMKCDIKNISIEHEKYNFTASNPGELSLGQADAVYTNLTSDTVLKKFNLDYRTDDDANDAVNSTYWRIYVPIGASGGCNGNIVFGAFQGAGN